MRTFRLRYEDGRLVPLDPLPDLKDGDEIEVEVLAAPGTLSVDEMLDRTRGLWADWDNDIEGLVEDARNKWDRAWREKLSSS